MAEEGPSMGATPNTWIEIVAPNAGRFRVEHGLGRRPVSAHLELPEPLRSAALDTLRGLGA
jgi:hypothetical protein